MLRHADFVSERYGYNFSLEKVFPLSKHNATKRGLFYLQIDYIHAYNPTVFHSAIATWCAAANIFFLFKICQVMIELV